PLMCCASRSSVPGRQAGAGLEPPDAGPPLPCSSANFAALPRVPVHSGGKVLPYCTSVSLASNSAAITHAVVVVHGNSRNVDGYFAYVATGQPPPPAYTVVVAPYFQVSTDNPQPNDLYWTSSSWKDGDDAVDEATSSFAALDALLLALRQS